jgi:hypothetical protein
MIPFGLLTTGQLPGVLRAQEVSSENLRIVVLQGEGFVNNVKKRVARDAVVEVRDRNNNPVAGATVSFLLPGSGPGGTFTNGGKLLTMVTDQSGRAVATGLKPNVAGQFRINVTASFQGATAPSVAISQTNIVTAGGLLGIGAAGTAAIVGGAAIGTAVAVAKVVTSGSKSARISVGSPSLH